MQDWAPRVATGLVLEIRGWFPIQLQHDPFLEAGAKKGPSSQGPRSYRAHDGKTFFATQAPTYFFISYVSKNIYSSRAKRSQDALRAGLVAIRSRQRVNERRSPEQGENGSAGCWPPKIHPHTQLLQAQAKTRSTRKHPVCKQSRTHFAQSMGKYHWSQQAATAHSFSHRQTLGRWAKISAKIATDRQIYGFVFLGWPGRKV